MALSLYPEAAYEEVFSVVTQGLAWAAGHNGPERVNKATISQARSKNGPEPLQHQMNAVCRPLADAKQHPWAFYAGLRIVAMDGSNFEVPDEKDNVEAFGYPGSRTGLSGFPQAHCAVLVECATHAIQGANIGAYRCSEWDISEPLLRNLKPDMLCLADRGFHSYAHWQAARLSAAHLLWRTTSAAKLPVRHMLSDGSYLSVLLPPTKNLAQASAQAVTVRVIEYALPDDAQAQPRCWTSTQRPRWSWRRCTTNDGKSIASLMNSRRTCAKVTACYAARQPPSFARSFMAG